MFRDFGFGVRARGSGCRVWGVRVWGLGTDSTGSAKLLTY